MQAGNNQDRALMTLQCHKNHRMIKLQDLVNEKWSDQHKSPFIAGTLW